jgi:hypothetical protein
MGDRGGPGPIELLPIEPRPAPTTPPTPLVAPTPATRSGPPPTLATRDASAPPRQPPAPRVLRAAPDADASPSPEPPHARPATPSSPRAPSAPLVVPPGVEPWVAAWQRVLRDLDDEPAHAELVALCARHGRLSYALDAYRRLESMRPGDARVRARLAQVARTIAAVGELPKRASTREGRALRTVGWWVVAMLVALMCSAIVVGVRRALDDEARPTPPPAASALPSP